MEKQVNLTISENGKIEIETPLNGEGNYTVHIIDGTLLKDVDNFILMFMQVLPAGYTIRSSGTIENPNNHKERLKNFVLKSSDNKIWETFAVQVSNKGINIYDGGSKRYSDCRIIHKIVTLTEVNMFNVFRDIFTRLTKDHYYRLLIKSNLEKELGMEVTRLSDSEWTLGSNEYSIQIKDLGSYHVKVNEDKSFSILGTFHEDDDAGRQWTETIESKKAEIEELKQEIAEIEELQYLLK